MVSFCMKLKEILEKKSCKKDTANARCAFKEPNLFSFISYLFSVIEYLDLQMQNEAKPRDCMICVKKYNTSKNLL